MDKERPIGLEIIQLIVFLKSTSKNYPRYLFIIVFISIFEMTILIKQHNYKLTLVILNFRQDILPFHVLPYVWLNARNS